MRKQAFVTDPELVCTLEKQSVPVPCDEGKLLFRQGDEPSGVYIVLSGAVTLMLKSPTGTVAMCLNAIEDSVLGLPAVIAHSPYTMTAMARPGSDVRFVSSEAFEEAIRADSSLSLRVLKLIAAEVQYSRLALSQG